MAKCLYCHRKKGKRSCPALKGEICSGCCGEHRGKEIVCPSDCSYFASNETYQQERVAAHFLQSWVQTNREIAQTLGEKGTEIAQFLDFLIFQYLHQGSLLTDLDIVAALDLLKRELGPLYLPGKARPPFGEILLKGWESFQKEKGAEAYPNRLGMEVFTRYRRLVSDFSEEGARSVRFIRGLVGFIHQRNPGLAAGVAAAPAESRIIRV